MNVKEAASLIALAITALPNLQEKELAPTAKFWAMVMPDVDFAVGQAAIIRIMREKKYSTLPLPAEIIEIARELKKSADTPPTAIEAWEEVRKNADLYKVVEWSHPAIRKAVQRIGVRNICGGGHNTANDFMDIYKQIVRQNTINQENKIAIQIAGKCSNLLAIATK